MIAAAFENPANGAHSGEEFNPLVLQRPLDRFRAELAQIACLLELTAQGQHKVLQFSGTFVGGPMRAPGAIRPVHAVQALRPGPLDPGLDRGKGYPKLRGDLPHRDPATHSRHDLVATLLNPVFLAMAVSLLTGLTAIL